MSAQSLIQAKGVSVRIERPSYAVDTGGGQVKTWGLVSNERWFIQPSTGDESIRYGGENTRKFFTAYGPFNTQMRNGDRMTWGARIFDPQGAIRAGEFTSGPLAHSVVDLEEHGEDE